jgi:riboflavin synthase
MFTGLIEEIGIIRSINQRGAVHNIAVEASLILDGMKIGDSIAVDGVCQTVTAFDHRYFTVQAVQETLDRTTFSELSPGAHVNLERSLRVGDRMGGHFVQGHVEATGVITGINLVGEGRDFRITVPTEITHYIAEKGSIALDGISLTVTFVAGIEFGVSVIPHTLKSTTLGGKRRGERINIETDVIAKYLDRLFTSKGGLTMETLKQYGF